MRRFEKLSQLATSQRGVATRAQMESLGFSTKSIDSHIRAGRLVRLYQGVYAIGHRALPQFANEYAAVLACGPHAFLSHKTAARVWGILGPATGKEKVDVSVLDAGHSHRGVQIHRPKFLHTDDQDEHLGIPITSPERTLLDLARRPKEHKVMLKNAYNQARILDRVTPESVDAVLGRYPRRPGCRLLRVTAGIDDLGFTRSEAEKRFLALVRKYSLPDPEVNAELCGKEVDFVWRDRRLVVEVDGYRYHSGTDSFESDRERDGDLLAARYRVLRVTWTQITDRPAFVANRIRTLLDSPHP